MSHDPSLLKKTDIVDRFKIVGQSNLDNLFTFIWSLFQFFWGVLQPSKSRFVHIYKILLC